MRTPERSSNFRSFDGSVCFIVEGLPVGGTERLVVNLCKELTSRGVQVKLACLPGPWGSSFLLDEVPSSVELWSPVTRTESVLGLRRFVDGSIAHFHLGRVAPGKRLALLGQSSVFTYHNTYFRRNLYRTRLDYLLSQTHCAITAVSNCVARYCFEHVGIPPHRLSVIHNAVPVGSKPQWKPPQDHIHLVTIGRLVQQKDQRTLLRAFAMLTKRNLGELTLTIVGDGPLMQDLRDLAERLGISSVVNFTGFQSQVRSVLGGASFFVSPSLWEGFGLVVAEAMAEGVPVIASRIAPHVEVLGETGLYFTPGSPLALSETLTRACLLSSPQLTQVGMRCYERVRSHFSIQECATRYLQLYEHTSVG